MLTPEQIDAALGALQQQIDDLRANTEPEPVDLCTTCCNARGYWRWREPWKAVRRLCDGCFQEPDTHPGPAVGQLQRAVKQAGERLAELEQIHADGTPPEGSVGHDFLCDRLDAIEKRLATLENVAGETPRELRDRLTRHVSNSNHWLCTVEERVTALEDNAHTPDPDFPPIATQEQVAAAYADRFAVAPSLKQRFGDWIDARTAQGIETYGQPLTTDNGRDAERDAFQELLDFCQYQEQSRQELLTVLRATAALAQRDTYPNANKD